MLGEVSPLCGTIAPSLQIHTSLCELAVTPNLYSLFTHPNLANTQYAHCGMSFSLPPRERKLHRPVNYMKNYYCLSLVADKEQKEVLLGICYSFGMEGSEEEEKEKSVLLKCYFQDRGAVDKAREHIKEVIPSAQIGISKIDDQDWNEKWRELIEPVKITENICVSPAWLKPNLKKGDHWIQIEPKMAFGTGHHETTRLAAQALLSIDLNEKGFYKLLDIGTGSGILCFVADYKGYSKSIGIEIDPDCFNSLCENKRVNEIKGEMSFTIGTIDSIIKEESFNTIVMNIVSTDSEPLLEKCRHLLLPEGHLVWSGLLLEERDYIINSTTLNGWLLVNELKENEWWCGVFKKDC